MFKVKLPINFDGPRYGMDFFKGEGETDDPYIAKRLIDKGFEVTEVAPEPKSTRGRKKTEKVEEDGV